MQDVAQEKVVELVEKLEGVAPHVWEIMVRQQTLEAWGYIVPGAICTLLTLFLLGCFILSLFDEDVGGDVKGTFFMFFVFSVPLSMWLTLAGAWRFLNPEYYAIMELIP